jgi:hypothetical protein
VSPEQLALPIAQLPTWAEDAAVENPRWTRCRAALGRQPAAYEFIIWNSRCWTEFAALHKCKDTSQVMFKLGAGAADAFDAWQVEGVRNGRWQAIEVAE